MSKKIQYITDGDGKISDVIVPYQVFEKMVEEFEDKKLIEMMEQRDKKQEDVVTGEETIRLINELLSK